MVKLSQIYPVAGDISDFTPSNNGNSDNSENDSSEDETSIPGEEQFNVNERDEPLNENEHNVPLRRSGRNARLPVHLNDYVL